jgi:D-psicose/D-tagatose/L-ribulose 3-epimerase
MKIGFCMLLWTTSVAKKHEALLRDIKATGYDGVEIPIFVGTPDDYAKLGATLDAIGLQRTAVTAMGDPAMNLISPDAATRKAGVDYMKWAIDCSEALGANTLSGPMHSTIGGFSGSGPTAAEKKRSVSSQRAIGDHAGKKGVTIGLEALNRFECYLFNTMADLSAHIDEIDRPHIKAMYDTFHANIEEKDPVGVIAPNIAQINHVHFSENDRGTPGKGHVPWAATMTALKQGGYDGWCVIEAFGRALPDLAAATRVWRDFFPNRDEVYQFGGKFLREQWAKA